jgi:hypothetical protein
MAHPSSEEAFIAFLRKRAAEAPLSHYEADPTRVDWLRVAAWLAIAVALVTFWAFAGWLLVQVIS